jgi:hypothetical protein
MGEAGKGAYLPDLTMASPQIYNPMPLHYTKRINNERVTHAGNPFIIEDSPMNR